MKIISKIFNYISAHFLLRNVIMAVCFVIVALFTVNIILNVYTRHGQKIRVPELEGKTVNQANELGKKNNLQIIVIDSLYIPKVPKGAILDQSPNANTSVKNGRKIFVTINASKPRTERIPYVVGYSLRQAKNMLENKGFEVKQLVYQNDIATNNVLKMNYNGVDIKEENIIEAELGQKITLTVGRNHASPLPMVPKVIGLTLREAKSRLWETGLNIGAIKPDTKTVKNGEYDYAKVYRQTPNQQMRAQYGGNVTLYITNNMKLIVEGDKNSNSEARRFVEAEEEDSTETLDVLEIE